ncbi:MAG: DUF11 domain-containing protein, partial [Gemmatimonadetes bacterium]|nr:DUF11 domain-containing protein [Gemmatimonadota bacterium]
WGSFAPVTKNVHYLVDVTGLARAWIEDGVPAEGLALLPTSPNRDSEYQSREFGGVTRHARLELYLSPAVDLTVSKTADLLQPAEGDTVRFTVEISNAGPEDASGVVVSDLLPAGLDYVTHAQTDGTWSKATGDWTISALGAGKTASLFFVTEVAAGTAGTSITNTATLTAVDQFDTTAADDTSSVTVDVQDPTVNGIDIQVIKTVDRRSAKVGDEVKFSILARNNGTAQAGNISIQDILPAGLTYVSSTSTRGVYDQNTGIWFILTFTGGDSGRLEITASVDPGTGAQTLVNTASLTSLTGTDLNPDNDADADSVFVLDTDLVLTKTVDLTNPEEGQPVRFRIDVENLGPTIAPNVAIADSLPAGLTWLADSTSQGTVSSGTGIWTLGNVDIGETQSLWITASPDSGTAGQTLRNAAGIVANDASDPTPDDDVAEASVVVASADLATAITVDDPQPVAGSTVTFTLTATNDGPSDATGVVLRTDLPTGLTYLADRPDVGTFDSGTGAWTLGSLLNGDTAALEIDAQVDPGTTGQTILVPVGRSGSSPADPNGGNDQDTVAVYVAGADLAVTKTVSKPEANEGENVIWTVTVANEGLLDATSVAVADTLPAGLSFVSA